ncbi:LytTR family transcriptional regulator DNA-binding domain-containing protein [Flavihumibacter sp. CACIAM 22H1]|uniref:LytTR family transcriptional regulator DNA-binding domain-containing protein n=1 Tax=Flavihumibacter sp. CACIAM 22H1 TaxID=1812911 RepID=UPI0025C44261|nr:LytTR family transcriptional regulator DNA-binding domain-containing protein [Flavihumibacter sp. CACIAM 22H1]
MIVLMLVLLNADYLAYYFYNRWKLAELKADRNKEEIQTEGKSSREAFLVQRGAESIPLPVETIAYFYRDGDYNYLATFEAERYLVSQSLDEVEGQLDKVEFFRANRKFIV